MEQGTEGGQQSPEHVDGWSITLGSGTAALSLLGLHFQPTDAYLKDYRLVSLYSGPWLGWSRGEGRATELHPREHRGFLSQLHFECRLSLRIS